MTAGPEYPLPGLKLEQPHKGYRFSQDAILLADFAICPSEVRVVDLGTGCGVVALMLAQRATCRQVVGVEIQPELARLAERNVRINKLDKRVIIICQAMQHLTRDQVGGAVDMVVSNPPFGPLAGGRLNPDRQNAIARHELKITLAELLATADRLLVKGGQLVMVYTADRLVDLLQEMRRHGIEPKCLQMVHAKAGHDARRVLIRGVKKGRASLRVLPPLVLNRPKQDR